MKVKVKKDIDIEKIVDSRLKYANWALTIQAQKDTDPFVPALSKSMANRGKVISDDDQRPLRERAEEETERAASRGEFQIVYPGPYARYLYRGKLMVDPETGSAWAKPGTTKVLKDKNLVFSQATAPQAQAEWFEASKAQNMKRWERVYERALKQKR